MSKVADASRMCLRYFNELDVVTIYNNLLRTIYGFSGKIIIVNVYLKIDLFLTKMKTNRQMMEFKINSMFIFRINQRYRY